MLSDYDYLLKKNTILIRALVVSGILNLIVLCLLSYWMIRERPPSPYCELKPQKKSNETIINPTLWLDKLIEIYNLPFNHLVDRLNSNQIVGHTYQEKDIALACLINRHYLDIQRALSPQMLPLDKHLIKLNKDSEITYLTIYPTLKKSDFNTIIQFIRTEHWPLTPQGLFKNLQMQVKNGGADPVLIETLSMSSEFWSIELLLNRSEASSLTKQEIATLISEGNWEILTEFAKQQRENHDLSDERRRTILLDYVTLNSSTAAELLITLDGDYVLKNMDDQQIISLLKLLSRKTAKNELFAKELLISPRSEQVWKNAANLLYTYTGEKKPTTWDYQNILTKFVCSAQSNKFQPFSTIEVASTPLTLPPKSLPLKVEKQTLESKKKITLYSVQKGDTLWKISRKFNVDIEKIRVMNQLKSDSIKLGVVLKIPT